MLRLEAVDRLRLRGDLRDERCQPLVADRFELRLGGGVDGHLAVAVTAQEYACQFLDTTNAVFRGEDIDAMLDGDLAPLFSLTVLRLGPV